MATVKNITNGEFSLNIDPEDVVSESFKFVRVPEGDIYDAVRRRDPNTQSNFYIESKNNSKIDIRTGTFSQISEKYSIETKSDKLDESHFTTNSFETEMVLLRSSVETKLSKSISFFQGIYAGMALLFTITLNLSETVSKDLVRVEDQCIRVLALLTTFGSFFSLFRARDRHEWIKLRGTSKEIEERYKTLILCIIEMLCTDVFILVYTISYIIFNIGHTYSVAFNISGNNYSELSTITTVYTILSLLGWVITNINTKKHEK